MSSLSLDLGHTVHRHVKHGWQLAATSAIQVTGLEDFAHDTTNSQKLELLTSRDLWVTRGEGLKIFIQIMLNGKSIMEAPGAAEVLETLGPIFCDAEVIDPCSLALE